MTWHHVWYASQSHWVMLSVLQLAFCIFLIWEVCLRIVHALKLSRYFTITFVPGSTMGADCLHSARIVDIADSVHCAFTLIHCVQFKNLAAAMWQFAQLLQNSSFSLWTVLSNPQKVQTAWTLDYKKTYKCQGLGIKSESWGSIGKNLVWEYCLLLLGSFKCSVDCCSLALPVVRIFLLIKALWTVVCRHLWCAQHWQ